MKCVVNACDCTITEILSVVDDGKNKWILCPNHELGYAIDYYNPDQVTLLPSELLEDISCSICKSSAIQLIAKDATYHLCDTHMKLLLRRDLSPRHVSILRAKHGKPFLLHNDFYNSMGQALNPF